MAHNVAFAQLRINEAFSPLAGQVGSTSVYIKKENGICPQVGVKGSEGIFWPEDRVMPVRLPEKVLKHYL